jgi:polyisoprenyl-phosphate glycosyltransferase
VTVWVVSPMLRDTESFVRLRAEVLQACTAAGETRQVRFVVVDDSAGTDAEVRRLDPFDDVRVITPPFNLGHQRAIVHALRDLAPTIADDDVVVTMDSDGEDQPADVPRLLAALEQHQVALVLAERTKRSEPLSFRLMYLFFRVFFWLLTGTTVQSGNFAAQRGDSLKATINHPSFDFCYSSTLLALRRPTTSVPCARGTRFAGASRMNRYSLIAHGIRMLLPLSERIAVRLLVLAATSFAALTTLLVLLFTHTLRFTPGSAAEPATLAVAVLFITSFCGFVSLFAGFRSQP